ncbi:hypothetical protein K439DRAFT_1660276 [Ramaria rubella]|nr:hypothetical protein K439DRAFT_1660276 [Ramaria rubella]
MLLNTSQGFHTITPLTSHTGATRRTSSLKEAICACGSRSMCQLTPSSHLRTCKKLIRMLATDSSPCPGQDLLDPWICTSERTFVGTKPWICSVSNVLCTLLHPLAADRSCLLARASASVLAPKRPSGLTPTFFEFMPLQLSEMRLAGVGGCEAMERHPWTDEATSRTDNNNALSQIRLFAWARQGGRRGSAGGLGRKETGARRKLGGKTGRGEENS